MNKTKLIGIALPLLVLSSVLAAGQVSDWIRADSHLSSWEKEALYEPCMNGTVSATGLYPSQVAEDKSFGTLGFIAENLQTP